MPKIELTYSGCCYNSDFEPDSKREVLRCTNCGYEYNVTAEEFIVPKELIPSPCLPYWFGQHLVVSQSATLVSNSNLILSGED